MQRSIGGLSKSDVYNKLLFSKIYSTKRFPRPETIKPEVRLDVGRREENVFGWNAAPRVSLFVFLSFLLIDERERRDRCIQRGVGVKSGSRFDKFSSAAFHARRRLNRIPESACRTMHEINSFQLRCECVTLGVTESALAHADDRARPEVRR